MKNCHAVPILECLNLEHICNQWVITNNYHQHSIDLFRGIASSFWLQCTSLNSACTMKKCVWLLPVMSLTAGLYLLDWKLFCWQWSGKPVLKEVTMYLVQRTSLLYYSRGGKLICLAAWIVYLPHTADIFNNETGCNFHVIP